MNAAARLFNQNALSRNWVLAVFLTRTQFLFSVVLMLVFLSAFSIVYITNAARDLHAGLYQSRVENDQLYGQEEQLLLERSTLSMQARVQQVAERTLNMVIPEHQSVVMINE